MNDLICITPDEKNQPTMSSREIAELTGKRHDNVLRDIDKMLLELEILTPSFLSKSKNKQNQTISIYNLPKRETLILVSGYSPKLRAKIIDRWIELETESQPKIPNNFAEALQLAADQAKQLELQAPKVEFAESIIESKGSVSIGEFAKIYGEYGRNIMFKILRGEKILMDGNVPYQRYVTDGYFELTEKDTPVGVKPVTRITGKGQAWLTKRLNKLAQ